MQKFMVTARHFEEDGTVIEGAANNKAFDLHSEAVECLVQRVGGIVVRYPFLRIRDSRGNAGKCSVKYYSKRKIWKVWYDGHQDDPSRPIAEYKIKTIEVD